MTLHVVTGGLRGLGRALVLHLLEEGHDVIAAARGEQPCTSDRLDWTSLDLADPEAAQAWILAALHRHARHRHAPSDPAVLILNAGMIDPLAPVRDLRPDELDRHLRLNLTAPIAITAGFLRATDPWNAERRVLAVSSGAARRGIPHWSAYCAAKAGLDGFVRTLNTETEHPGGPVLAVSLAPGVVDTDMQRTVRTTPTPTRARFQALHDSGLLAPAADTAAHMLAYLRRPDFGAVEIDQLPVAPPKPD